MSASASPSFLAFLQHKHLHVTIAHTLVAVSFANLMSFSLLMALSICCYLIIFFCISCSTESSSKFCKRIARNKLNSMYCPRIINDTKKTSAKTGLTPL